MPIALLFSNALQAQDTTIHKVADQMPEPVGGIKSFYEYIESNLQYPQEARQLKLQGRVMVKFVVEPDGSLSNIEVSRGIGGGCDEEAIRLLRNAPKWKPGKKGGKEVRVEVSRPIIFKLDM
jgi:protein TonB